MKLDTAVIRGRCNALGIPLTRLLSESKISRTAYYSLARRESVLPGTVLKLAEALGTTPEQLLDGAPFEERRAKRRLAMARRIASQAPPVEFQSVWHTLALLDEPPLDRLNRALLRGQAGTASR